MWPAQWLTSVSLDALVGVLIFSPVVCGMLVYTFRTKISRKGIVTAAGWVLSGAALLLFAISAVKQQPITFTPPSIIGVSWTTMISVLDLILLAAIAAIGARIKSPVVIGLAVLQILGSVWLEFGSGRHHLAGPALYVDWLTVTMVMIVSVIGSIIAVYGLPYMKEHERHLKIAEDDSRRPRFFLTILAFLGAMNGLVLANDLRWVLFFWEVTTLCSFILISHDKTREARQNAHRALWINLIGGTAFVAALVVLHATGSHLTIQDLIAQRVDGRAAVLLLPMALLVLAAFTKSAQMPFQSWLLGAMVAPTPVSALLHSSTMVKAGVYLVMRLAPVFQGSRLSDVVAVAGAFTFVACAFLAIGQTNAKKVLAYSTISNLGLIIACAGMNTPLAMAAAVMLMIFHAISKALLFMAAGVVEHGIWSRDIEDMEGLVARMPLTTFVMVIGILSMLLPPFGVLIAKLAAIEASTEVPAALLLLVLGSTLTVAFWVKWMGRLLSVDPGVEYPRIEHLHSMYFVPLLLLTVGAVAFSLAVMPLLSELVEPAVSQSYAALGPQRRSDLSASVLGVPWALIFAFLAASVAAPLLLMRTKKGEAHGAYLCGEQASDAGVSGFVSVADARVELSVRGYYFDKIVGETIHMPWMMVVAGAMLIALFMTVLVKP